MGGNTEGAGEEGRGGPAEGRSPAVTGRARTFAGSEGGRTRRGVRGDVARGRAGCGAPASRGAGGLHVAGRGGTVFGVVEDRGDDGLLAELVEVLARLAIDLLA